MQRCSTLIRRILCNAELQMIRLSQYPRILLLNAHTSAHCTSVEGHWTPRSALPQVPRPAVPFQDQQTSTVRCWLHI